MGIHQTGIQTQSVFFDSLYGMCVPARFHICLAGASGLAMGITPRTRDCEPILAVKWLQRIFRLLRRSFIGTRLRIAHEQSHGEGPKDFPDQQGVPSVNQFARENVSPQAGETILQGNLGVLPNVST